jgi:hypothetical protein
VPTYLQWLGSRYNGLYKCVFPTHPTKTLRNYSVLCRAAGRAIPDISAQAFDYFMIEKNLPYSISGTSCAALVTPPRFALEYPA